MSEQKFEKGQLILARIKVEENTYSWNVYQYIGENHEKVFVLSGFLTKEHSQFIPYEGNEELLGTCGDPAPKWYPKPGELVAVASDKRFWYPKFFFFKDEDGQFVVKSCPEHMDYDRYLYCEPLRNHFNVPEK